MQSCNERGRDTTDVQYQKEVIRLLREINEQFKQYGDKNRKAEIITDPENPVPAAYPGEIAELKELEMIQVYVNSLPEAEQLGEMDTKEKIRKIIEGLKKEVKSQKNKNESLEQRCLAIQNLTQQKQQLLQNRFANGYTLFSSYPKLDRECRDHLSGVIRHPDLFENFICCLAQAKTMERLWDEIYACVMGGKEEAAQQMNVLFDYSMELVNKTLSAPYYQRLAVREGTAYEREQERLILGSSNQGKIRTVYLQGYENTYSGQIIRKTLVAL